MAHGKKMGGQIFISYRREDNPAWARLVHNRLSQHFSQSEIFMDVDTIEPGVDFIKAIEGSVGSCDVLIAVIGVHWLSAVDPQGGRRLDNAEDYVRLEIATALRREIRVIPVLVDGAKMPEVRELPDDLRSLVRRNALQLSQDRFRSDSELLITAVDHALKEARAERRKRGVTSPGKRTWLSIAGVLTVLAIIIVAAINFSSHPSKSPKPEVSKPPSVTPAAPLVVETSSPAAVATPSVVRTKIGFNPQDRFMMAVGNTLVVVTQDGNVFGADVAGRNVRPVFQFGGAKIGFNPQDSFMMALGNTLIVVTQDGNVFGADVVGRDVGPVFQFN